MGVIFISILLGGFTQDNIGALLAGEDASFAAKDANGFRVSLNALILQNSYQGLVTVLKPSVGIRLGAFTVSAGYLLSPGGLVNKPAVNWVPVTLDAAFLWSLRETFTIRPRISLIGPSTFFPTDPYSTYKLYLTAGAGADAVYDPFKAWTVRPVFSLGADAGYAFGTYWSAINGFEEPLEGFGFSANAAVAGIYSMKTLNASLEARLSYSGRLIPDISLSFLW